MPAVAGVGVDMGVEVKAGGGVGVVVYVGYGVGAAMLPRSQAKVASTMVPITNAAANLLLPKVHSLLLEIL